VPISAGRNRNEKLRRFVFPGRPENPNEADACVPPFERYRVGKP
jgi:hypothetical protein